MDEVFGSGAQGFIDLPEGSGLWTQLWVCGLKTGLSVQWEAVVYRGHKFKSLDLTCFKFNNYVVVYICHKNSILGINISTCEQRFFVVVGTEKDSLLKS